MKCEVMLRIGFVLVLVVLAKTFEVPCRSDGHCEMFLNSTWQDAFCEDGVCKVKSFIERNCTQTMGAETKICSSNEVTKRPPRGFGDKCTNTLQCVEVLQVGGECWNGICQCRLKYHYNSTYSLSCIRDRSIGEYCDPEEYQCYQWDESFNENVMYCTEEHRCRCVKNWTVEDDACEYSNASNVGIRVLSIAMVIVLAKML